MALAKVWNDSEHEWKEKFKGDLIVIPAKSFIEMEFYDAHAFKGQFPGIFLDANDQQIPQSMKIIRVEGEPPGALKTDQMNCQMCKEKFLSFASLNDHVSLRHKDSVIVDEEAEEAIATKRRGRKPKSEATTQEGA